MTHSLTGYIVAALPASVPFVGPETQERARARPFAARIGANESVFGPSPAAIEAMRRAAPEQWMYCDPDQHDLREALASHHGVPPESLVIGEGIDGLFTGPADLSVAYGKTDQASADVWMGVASPGELCERCSIPATVRQNGPDVSPATDLLVRNLSVGIPMHRP